MQFRYGLQAVQIQDRAIVVCSVRYGILLAGRSFDAVLLAHQETKSSARQEQHKPMQQRQPESGRELCRKAGVARRMSRETALRMPAPPEK